MIDEVKTATSFKEAILKQVERLDFEIQDIMEREADENFNSADEDERDACVDDEHGDYYLINGKTYWIAASFWLRRKK